MRRNLLAISLLAIGFSSNAQTSVSVGSNSVATVTKDALVFNGGGLNLATEGNIKNHGNVMLMGAVSDKLSLETNSDFTLHYDDKTSYGQLYISGITDITGKVNKEYKADANISDTGSQQMALPFEEANRRDDLLALLSGTLNYLNITNGSRSLSGRWAPNSVFRWNNERSRFDQLVQNAPNDMLYVTTPTDYYLVPRRDTDGIKWDAETQLKTFSGTPIAESVGNISMTTTILSSFGANGGARNYFGERYNTYITDPFHTGTAWEGTYGINTSQFGNPYFTNLDLYHLAEIGLDMTQVEGIAYYGSGSLSWSPSTGGTYNGASTMTIVKTDGNGNWQVGPTDPNYDNALMIKPLGTAIIKFNSNINPTIDLGKGRKFSNAISTTFTSGPTGRMVAKSNIPADKLVKQVAVLALDSQNNELGRTYYAVSLSATTGKSDEAKLQAAFDNPAIYTKEEIPTGGTDEYSPSQLYINEANEVDYKGKEIPLVLNDTNIKNFKFLVYEGGKVVDALSNGEHFYIESNNKNITQIISKGSLPANGTEFKLYYGTPENGVLDATSLASRSQTIIVKNQSDWVVRFANSWKSAKIEVYSASGQLVHAANNVSTVADYTIPINTSNGLFIVKATSDSGETVIKKILK